MTKHLILIAIIGLAVVGCRTPEARSAVEADKIAYVVGHFIAFRGKIPGDLAALQTFADGDYGVRWRHFRTVSFQPVTDFGVRIEFHDFAGESDYRNVVVSHPGLHPFALDPAASITNDTAKLTEFLTDPKTTMHVYHAE